MTGTVVQLSFGALRSDWPGLTCHGGSCPTEACVGASVSLCVRCSTERDTRLLYPKRQRALLLYLCTKS